MLSVEVVHQLPGFALDVAWDARLRVVALVGPSGAGKTLTLDCLAGLVRPDRGRIALDGRTFFDSRAQVDEPPQRRRLGYVFQGYALFPHMTVADNVAYGLHGHPPAARRERARLVLERLGLDGLGHRLPLELSGGQQQRVALARALAIDPDLLLLDEPLSALDVPLRRELRRELARTLREWEKTTVVVTHDLGDAYELADEVVVYEGGRVVAAAEKSRLLWQPTSERVARLIGIRNLLGGTLRGTSRDRVTIDWRGATLEAANPPAHPVTQAAGSRLSFFVRPEYVRLVPADRPPADGGRPVNALDGTIVREIDEGTRWVLWFLLEGEGAPSQGTYDLEIEVPKLVYDMLDIGRERRWTVSILPGSIQVLPGA